MSGVIFEHVNLIKRRGGEGQARRLPSSWEATRTDPEELYSERPRGGTARQLTM